MQNATFSSSAFAPGGAAAYNARDPVLLVGRSRSGGQASALQAAGLEAEASFGQLTPDLSP